MKKVSEAQAIRPAMPLQPCLGIICRKTQGDCRKFRAAELPSGCTNRQP